jgi:hypothetical protein
MLRLPSEGTEMTLKFDEGVENIHAAHSEARMVREHGPYGILVGDEMLHISPVVISDPVPTGQQILIAAGFRQPAEHLLFQMLSDGQLEEIRPEETTDLRICGAEKFLVFHSDRSFRLQLDDRTFEWGATLISGATLKCLAGVSINDHDVWLHIQNGADQLIGDTELADLTKPGVEHFSTRPITIAIVVNAKPRTIHVRRLPYWEIVKLGYPEAVQSDNIIYTVNFARGPAVNPEGSLAEGQCVFIKEGMTFYVTPTDKS